MTGVLWAAASGIGFGLFQSVNVRAVRQLEDVYVSTFLQLLVAAAVLLVACIVAGDLPLLSDASAWAWISFALAGAIHFFLGWTLLNASQDRIGAARTSPLLTTTPLFGVAIAAVTLGQLPGAAALAGIAVTVAGALVITDPRSEAGISWQDSTPGLATAFLWALSPVFTIEGLDELDSPLLGVTIGMVFSVLAYALVLAAEHTDLPPGVFLNVNFPTATFHGVRIPRLGKRIYNDQLIERQDPRGRTYYWMGGNTIHSQREEGTDVAAIEDGYVSITPIHLDLTGRRLLKRLKTWSFALTPPARAWH